MKFQDIPKFVVNLETRPDNLELIKKEMDYMGWEFEKFNAINRNSYMGCTLSHLGIIQIAKDENQNVIKIVHGKGPEAILKTYVNGWLRQHRDVLAFVSAPEKQGGTGAVLVLLKRSDKNPKFKQ